MTVPRASGRLPDRAPPPRVAVVGLGKLGACIAACFAQRGLTVTGVDRSRETVRLVQSGLPPVFEPGLAEAMAGARERVTATASYREAVAGSDFVFIVVPTPSDESGGFSLSHVEAAVRSVGRALREIAGYRLVVLTSTVLPGATASCVLPALERESGRRVGEDLGLCYSPEFIALGSVIHDFLNPDFVLIGESDPRAGALLAGLYGQVCLNDPPVVRMNLVNAELAKIAVNTFVTMKITFANTLGALCERLPGGDVDVVTRALGMDSRIGPRYLTGGLGYGGPCFPRDNRAFAHFAGRVGERADLAEATDSFNRTIVGRLARQVRARAPERGRVALLGVSYKPASNVVEASQGIELARELAGAGYRVIVHDPVALDGARRALGRLVAYEESAPAAIAGADVVVLVNPDPEFRSLVLPHPAQAAQVVIDAWRLLRGSANVPGDGYHPLGVGPPARPAPGSREPADGAAARSHESSPSGHDRRQHGLV